MAHDLHTSPDPDLPAKTDEVRPPRLRKPPFWMIALGLIATVATWVPLVLSARARVSRSDMPRVHIIQDMGRQPKYKEQQASEVFADGAADRPRIVGTVARGKVQADDFFERGFSSSTGADGKLTVKFFDGYPDQIQKKLSDAKTAETLLKRGHDRFNIYCSACHGYDGQGNGSVAQRSLDVGQPLNPANLTDHKFWEPANGGERANGHIYNTINVGIRNMGGYGPQITPGDRWAIVAYVRALQLGQNAPPGLVPDAEKAKLTAAK